jgi:hypothetical protein
LVYRRTRIAGQRTCIDRVVIPTDGFRPS